MFYQAISAKLRALNRIADIPYIIGYNTDDMDGMKNGVRTILQASRGEWWESLCL